MCTSLPRCLLQELPKPSAATSPQIRHQPRGYGGDAARKSLLLKNGGGLSPNSPRPSRRSLQGGLGDVPQGGSAAALLGFVFGGARRCDQGQLFGEAALRALHGLPLDPHPDPDLQALERARGVRGAQVGPPQTPRDPANSATLPLTFFSFCCWITRSFFGAMVRPEESVAGLRPERFPGPPH